MGSVEIIMTIRLRVEAARAEEVLQTLRITLEPTRVETGCLEYRCTRGIEDANTFVILQRWSTEEDFREHVQSDGFRLILGALERAQQQPRISIYHVLSTEGMETIRRMRESHGTERAT